MQQLLTEERLALQQEEHQRSSAEEALVTKPGRNTLPKAFLLPVSNLGLITATTYKA